MNHDTARVLMGADPHGVSPELTRHLAGCAECSQFQHEMMALDNDIRRALGESPWKSVQKAQTVRYARARQGWAVAASVALLTLIIVWAFRPNESLAHEVVRHVRLESNSWASDAPVTPAETRETLAHAGVELDTSSNQIVYARSCPFRGHSVPHLVVNTPKGRVTVLILRDESVQRRMEFHEEGMSGVITPAPRGSIAVLMRGDENVDAISQEVRRSVRWLL